MKQLDCSFLGYNNTNIYAIKNCVNNPKANVVIVHGIFEHLDRYQYLSKKLTDAGYNVYRYDARGHGRSQGERGDVSQFDHYLLDLDSYITKIKNEHPELKLILLGHSMGGLVATSYVAFVPNRVDYLVLSGACNRTPKQAKLLRYIPTFVTKWFKYKNKLGDGVCGNEAVVKEYNEDELVLKQGSLRLMKNAFIKGCNLIKSNIKNIGIPTLIMHGEEDGIVDVETSIWTYENLSVEDKRLKVYPKMYHEIFNEVDKDEVIEDLIEWINKRIGG